MKTCVLNIAPGKTVRYCGAPCIVLEHRQDGTLLVVTEQIKYEFGPSNNFSASPLRAHLNTDFLDSLTLGHPDEIITRTVDLTALNGSTEYGTVECKLAPLTLDELRKYHDILPRPEGFEWSATPWSIPKVGEDDVWVLGLSSRGVLGSRYCFYTGGSRPAFLIPSTLTVEVDGDEDQEGQEAPNPLAAYSKLELVEELYRREWVE